ncbi:EamA family transporter RarD [Oxalobacteraceae bacterium]|nr:EamA family transporter RarD [Oxalobacteraceae bacterium]
MNSGIVYAITAFLLWGLFPLYFHAINNVPASEILAHRVVWSLLFLAIVLTARGQWKWLPQLRHQPRVIASFIASSALLTVNWLTYIWAVNNGHVIDGSLGYYINPLANVLLGFLILKERPRRGQWIAIGLAACGVLWLAVQAGQVPWIALIIATSFAGYGLLRKTASLAALEGLSFETMIMFPIALAYLGWLAFNGHNTFLSAPDSGTRWLLAAAGPITAIPLLLFTAGARKIPLSVLGMLQYMSPTMQILLGLTYFGESFDTPRLIGFAIIWSALALYAAEGLWTARRAST